MGVEANMEKFLNKVFLKDTMELLKELKAQAKQL